MSVVVGSTTYRVYYFDLGGGLLVNGGDQFRTTGNAVALTSGAYTFYLLWSDGSQIQTSSWNIA